MKKTKKSKDLLSKIFSEFNQELSSKDREKRTQNINFYLANYGGVIIAMSCRDGILLSGINPNYEKTIFQVFHRIGLLGIGKESDCEEIHTLSEALAFNTSLKLSKADIKARDIIKEIAKKLDKNFSYSGSGEGSYKANFIIAELGFKPEEDFIDFVSFCGERSLKNKSNKNFGEISELPELISRIISKDDLEKSIAEKTDISKKNKKVKENTADVEAKEKEEMVLELKISEEYPITKGLNFLINKFYSQGIIFNIKEAALFVGLLSRLLNNRGGELEMAYLDRDMLKKTKTEERRFHHIWQRITNPNPYKPSDPWKDWKKFVASTYKKVKIGELYPGQEILIDLYEILEQTEFSRKEMELLKKVEREELARLMKGVLETKYKE